MSYTKTLQAGIEHHLRKEMREYEKRIPHYTNPKVLRDVIWGFNRYEEWELSIIDSPPFQRLRHIFQTSLALYTYPCAVHSRFEHSLGVATVASRMLAAIRDCTTRNDPVMEIETRLAALLHDVGHGPFSHSSERYYETLTDKNGRPVFGSRGIVATENPVLFADASASEIMTYLLLTTDTFKGFWHGIVDLYKKKFPDLRNVNLGRVASMILGTDSEVGEDKRFYRQIVNGPFDADKLDYLPRDGYFTGLSIVVDIERLLNVIKVLEKNGQTELGVIVSGASVMEQILFGKTQIFACVYHHQKVRAAHRLLLHLLRTMHQRGFKPVGMDLGDPTSYQVLDDYDLLQSHTGDAEIDSIVRRLKHRDLPKRALFISHACYNENDSQSAENFDKLDPQQLASIEQDVERNLKLPPGSIFFDIPDSPKLMGTAQAVVEVTPERILHVSELYPTAAWSTAFSSFRKVAYVFTTAEDRRAVGIAVRDALASLRYPIRLNEYCLVLAKP